MGLVLTTISAELLQLHPVGVVTPVLLGDIVTVLAHLACHCYFRPHIGTGSHDGSLSSLVSNMSFCVVAMAGLEPAT